jgi:hypothetical protein
MDSETFYVFSGGKVEFRKAQDLVLLAFKRFHERYKDSVLVTAWHSPWPQLSVGFKGRLSVAVELAADGRLDIGKWVVENGLDPRSVIDIGFVPNALMPALFEMDAAIAAVEGRGCTSLPVGRPGPGGSGHRGRQQRHEGLLTDENCIAPKRQTTIDDRTLPR